MDNNYNINLNLLRYFIVAAESSSLAEAGEKLGYSSSTVSTNISTLENQLGVKLFTRKPLKLTNLGEDIYIKVKKGLLDIDFAMIIADSKNNIECGNVSIGCPSHIVDFYLMEKLSNATVEYPNLKINLDTSYECEDLIEAVKENKIDFAILDRIPSKYEKDIEIMEITRSEYIFIADKPIVINNINELKNYKYVLSGEQRENSIKLTNILKKYGVELEVRLRCRTYRTKNKCSKIRNWSCLCVKRGS